MPARLWPAVDLRPASAEPAGQADGRPGQGGAPWVTNWVTTGTADAGRPRTMVDRSGSSPWLLAQLIDV